jgi:glycosyltransferase involved in cell wall biosynthesis
MNILELNFEKGWRGGERQTLYNMQGFREASITVHLVCRKGSSMETMAVREGFITHSFKSIIGVIFFLIQSGNKYDFLHAQTSQILTYCVFTKYFNQAKIIFTRRVNFIQKGFTTKLKYRFTEKIIAISPAVKSTLESFTNRTDIEVIPDIVVSKDLDRSRASELISRINTSGKRVVGTIAALTKEKDPYTLVEAIKKLSEKRNDFIFFHFGSGDLKNAIEKKIKEDNLDQVYFLMGFVEDVEDLFSVFEVFVMTSKEEGLGSSVLDSFMYKVPVVSTNAGGLKDLVKDERGISCEIGDSDSIAKGIDVLLLDESVIEIYVQKAFDYVCHYHSMEFVTDQYLRYIKNDPK